MTSPKVFLYAAILGFACWGTSEIIEILHGGYSPVVYYLTAAYHFLAGFGIWGLHRSQTPRRNLFNSIGAVLASFAYVALTYFPIAVMHSGLNFGEYMEANPIFKIPAAIWFLGMILFGIAVLRSKFYPLWTGFVILVGTIIFTASPLLGWPTIPTNISNIIFALTVIYMATFGIRNYGNDRL